MLTSEGHCKTLTIDPSRTEALFWSDRAVNEILAPFYERTEKFTTQEELINRFGPGIKKAFTTLGINSSLKNELFAPQGGAASKIKHASV